LKRYEAAVLLFAKRSTVAFTNNRAERDLRMSKVKQKVSGCFRTQKYAEAYCRISSYLQTMANQGYNPLVAIQLALSGQIYAERRE
jgi:transposase